MQPAEAPADGQRFSVAALEAWCVEVLVGVGLSHADASVVARMLVRTDARGYTTHGLSRLRSYLDKIATGEILADAVPTVTRAAGYSLVEAHGGLGQTSGPYAIDLGVEATNDAAVFSCGLRNTGHLGALGLHVLRAAEAGRVAVIMQSTPPMVSLPGAAGPMLGNNPLALAAPRPNGAPIVIDLACSVAARGNIILAQRAGHDIPSGWALDASGAPTQDPREALAGSLLPFGGYKGLMVAAMVEILAGSLSGAPFQAVLNTGGAVRSAPGGVNAFILVLNPDLMIGRAAYDAHVAAWTSHYIAMGGPDGRIPGQRAFEAEQNCSSAGIPLPLSVQQDLAFLSEKYGVPLPQP